MRGQAGARNLEAEAALDTNMLQHSASVKARIASEGGVTRGLCALCAAVAAVRPPGAISPHQSGPRKYGTADTSQLLEMGTAVHIFRECMNRR